MKRTLGIAPLALLIFLIACQAPAPTETVAAPPSRTPTPSATFNATQWYQATLQANQTQNARYGETQEVRQTSAVQTREIEALTPTATRTPVPSPTPTATPILPKGDSQDYELFPLAFDNSVILQLGSLGYRQTSECYRCVDESLQFSQIVDYETTRLNPLGFSADDYSHFLHLLSDGFDKENWYVIWEWPQSLIDNFSLITLTYLNEKGTQFTNLSEYEEDFFTATAYQLELDHDPESEWLIRVIANEYPLLTWIVLDQADNGTYRLLSDELWNARDINSFAMEVGNLSDLNGDGLTDVILVLDSYFGFGLYVLRFNTAFGSPDGLTKVSEIDVSYSGQGREFPEYEFRTAENGLWELVITETKYWAWDCTTEDVTTYSWAGGIEHVTPNLHQLESIQCLIAEAVDIYEPPETPVAILWLERALSLDISQNTLRPEERNYVYYKLALLNLLEGKTSAARYHLSFIQAASDQGTPEIAVNLWGEIEPLPGADKLVPYSLCLASQNLALTITDISIFGDIYSYPYQGFEPGYSTPLCESTDLTLEILDGLSFNSYASLETALQSAGLTVNQIVTVTLSEPSTAFLVILQETNTPHEYGYDYPYDPSKSLRAFGYLEGYGWQYQFYLPPDFKILAVNSDVTGDGINEIGYAYRKVYEYCSPEEDSYDIAIISGIGFGYADIVNMSVCVNEIGGFHWENFLEDKNGDGLSDWIVKTRFSVLDDPSLIAEAPVEIPWLLDWNAWRTLPEHNKRTLVTDLHTRFLTSPSPASLRPEIEFYRDRWGAGDDEISSQIYAHLTYLLALTYELEGDETTAVELFHDIWANHPNTLWAQLAASRLQLK